LRHCLLSDVATARDALETHKSFPNLTVSGSAPFWLGN